VKRKALAMPSSQKEGIDNAFGSKYKALATSFVQKEGIANAFESKGRHWQCLYLDIYLRFVKIVNNYS
jgi:hypothetical protein